MSKQAMVEQAMLDGLDERAAAAIVEENDGIHNKPAVVLRAAEAQYQEADAAA